MVTLRCFPKRRSPNLCYNSPVSTPDYLAIGHLSRDLLPQGERWGGSVAYAALTARALGLRSAVVTAAAIKTSPPPLADVDLVCKPAAQTTTFALTETPAGRRLRLLAQAEPLTLADVPPGWRRARLVHLAPIAQELPLTMAEAFAGRFVGLTAQGWLRTWDQDGVISPAPWETLLSVLPWVTATVLSIEDLGLDDLAIPYLAERSRVLVVTRGPEGADLYWFGEHRHIPAPPTPEHDAVGAGDIFAAAFFVRLYHTGDALEAAHFATRLAALSVTRAGLDSAPTPTEMTAALPSPRF